MEYLKQISLDVGAAYNRLWVPAKQGDKVLRKLAITLLADGQAYTPDDVTAYQFRCAKPDDTAVVLESDGTAAPIVANNGVYTVTLSEQCLAVCGRCHCDFVLLDSSGDVLSTANFILDVIPMPDIGNLVDSSTEWERLEAAIEQAEQYGDVAAFRVDSGNFQYTLDGTTWVTICPVSDFAGTITEAQIRALF